jgi:hypothetical protein
MPPKSNSSTATSIDATQRRLNVGIVLATLLTLAGDRDLASGGRLIQGAARRGDDTRWRLAIPYRRRATLGERQYRR